MSKTPTGNEDNMSNESKFRVRLGMGDILNWYVYAPTAAQAKAEVVQTVNELSARFEQPSMRITPADLTVEQVA